MIPRRPPIGGRMFLLSVAFVVPMEICRQIREFVPSGTCHFWKGMAGKSAWAVREAPGVN